MTSRNFMIEVHDDGDGMLWGEVLDLPGCFISGKDMSELVEAAAEAIGMYLSDTEDHTVEDGLDPGRHRHPIDLEERRRQRVRRRQADARAVRYRPRKVEIAIEAEFPMEAQLVGLETTSRASGSPCHHPAGTQAHG
jgi:predicted RNase H-like HicB family nuclease